MLKYKNKKYTTKNIADPLNNKTVPYAYIKKKNI